jgi:hypothetical protein
VGYLDENGASSSTGRPILIDITNRISSRHEVLREVARQNLKHYTEKMSDQMNKGRKRPNNFEIGDLVRISIPRIDRFGTDRPTLPCKILGKTNHGQYRLGSKFGIIGVLYSSGELEPLGVNQFPELETIPMDKKISLREAARLQNIGAMTSTICNCKGSCDNKRCCCKKVGNNCGSRCHGGRQCRNKCEN